MTCHSYAHLHKNIDIIHKPHLNIRSTDGRSFRSVEQSQINTEWPLYRQPEIPRQFAALLRGTRHACYSHIMPILVLNTCMDATMQFTMNSFRQLFPDKIFPLTFPWYLVKSLTFPWQLSNSLTFPGFPDKWSPWTQDINKQMNKYDAKSPKPMKMQHDKDHYLLSRAARRSNASCRLRSIRCCCSTLRACRWTIFTKTHSRKSTTISRIQTYTVDKNDILYFYNST